MEELIAAIDHYEKEGERRFSRWDGSLYRAFIEGPGDRLWSAIAGGADGNTGDLAKVFEAYLRLVVEAIGCGYVDAASLDPKGGRPVANLMTLLFVDRIPALLHRAPVGDQVKLLAKAWNLAEGLIGDLDTAEFRARRKVFVVEFDGKNIVEARYRPIRPERRGLAIMHGIVAAQLRKQWPPGVVLVQLGIADVDRGQLAQRLGHRFPPPFPSPLAGRSCLRR